VNGRVDRAGRALVDISLRPSANEKPTIVAVWVDTAFTGELVMPRHIIDQLGLSQSSAVMAGLADGTEVVLETFSCVVEWLGEPRSIEVVESDAQILLLGVGLLRGHKLTVDYRMSTIEIA